MAAEASVIDMSDLKDLEPLSKRLNAASDEFTRALQSIQERLNALGIGLEVWVTNSPLKESDWSDVFDRSDEPTGDREFWADELGYGRHGDGWALLVRHRRHVESSDHTGRSVIEAYDDSNTPVALLKASRDLRVAAVPVIPELIDAIKAEAQRVIERVEQAKKIADSLK